MRLLDPLHAAREPRFGHSWSMCSAAVWLIFTRIVNVILGS